MFSKIDQHFFTTPIKIGTIEVKNRVFLAPLAGVSDSPFRRICQSLGAGLTYVEMLSATALRHRNSRTFDMMFRHKDENILGVQVTGPSPEEIQQAVGILHASGFETIDLNMGCPVKKVVGAGCGSAILKDQEKLRAMVCAARSATSLPLSVKVRLGYTRQEVNIDSTIHNAFLGKADMITVHGRTRSEGYDTPVDLGGIRRAVETLHACYQRPAGSTKEANALERLPLVGNGDVFSFRDALKMVHQSNCEAVMVSRGALGNPWIFKEILLGRSYSPSLTEWHEVVLQHLQWHQEQYGDTKLAAILMRKHLLWYAKGFPGAKSLRQHFNMVESLDDARTILKDYVSRHSSGLLRVLASEGSDYDPKYEMDRSLDRGVGHIDLECSTQSGTSETLG